MKKILIALGIVFLIFGMVSIAAAGMDDDMGGNCCSMGGESCCSGGGSPCCGGGSDPIPVPEPSTFLLLGSGLLGLIAFRIRRKR